MKTFHAPPPFVASGELRTFAKFDAAKYQIEIDSAGRVKVQSKIAFDSFVRGTPIIDLHLPLGDQSADVWVDGDKNPLETVAAPDGATTYRAVQTAIESGRHVARIRHEAEALKPGGSADGTVAFLKMDDLQPSNDPWDSRLFLERYLPSNLEFDPHRIRIDLRAPSVRNPFLVTNGLVASRGSGEWRIEFPEWFTPSCPFLFLGDASEFAFERFRFPRPGGDPIDVLLFASGQGAERMSRARADLRSAWVALAELQARFGPFPYDSLGIYLTNNGMEYAGAAEVSGNNMLHELAHSYFGRCVLPADGSAGWVDEAIASWCAFSELELNYPETSDAYPHDEDPGPIGRQSPYRRSTSVNAYDVGRRVIGFLDRVLRKRGGILPLLARFRQEHAFRVITTADFQRGLERYAGQSLAAEFETFVYGSMPLEDYLRYVRS